MECTGIAVRCNEWLATRIIFYLFYLCPQFRNIYRSYFPHDVYINSEIVVDQPISCSCYLFSRNIVVFQFDGV